MALKSSPVSLELNCRKTTSWLRTSDGPRTTSARFCPPEEAADSGNGHQGALKANLSLAGERPRVGDLRHRAADVLRPARLRQRGDVVVVVVAAAQQPSVAGIQSDACARGTPREVDVT